MRKLFGLAATLLLATACGNAAVPAGANPAAVINGGVVQMQPAGAPAQQGIARSTIPVPARPVAPVRSAQPATPKPAAQPAAADPQPVPRDRCSTGTGNPRQPQPLCLPG